MVDWMTLIVAQLPGVLAAGAWLFASSRGIDRMQHGLDEWRHLTRPQMPAYTEICKQRFDMLRADLRQVMDRLDRLNSRLADIEERRA